MKTRHLLLASLATAATVFATAPAVADTGSAWFDGAVRKLGDEIGLRNTIEEQGHGFAARHGYQTPEMVTRQLFGDEAFMVEIASLQLTARLQKLAAWQAQP